MPIENSIFASDWQIDAFLRDYYGFENNCIVRINEGSANCYKIINDNGVFFLKEFQSKYQKNIIDKEIDLCCIISSLGIPTSEFIKGIDDFYVIEYQGHCFHLQKYIDGYMFERHKMNDTVLFESAELLGKIHLGLKDVDYLADGFTKDWFYDWSVEKSIIKHKKIIIDAANSNSPYADKIINACERKIDLLNDYCEDYLKYIELTKVNSHGDYNHLQILCDTKQNKINAIIDFSSAECVPAVWEIIRSYSYGASECSDLKINLQKFKKYIDRYLKYRRLSLFDVSNMAGFYYYNLLRSTYGFNSNSDKLIEFALWRTDFCEYLSRSYKDIDKFLHKEYESIL